MWPGLKIIHSSPIKDAQCLPLHLSSHPDQTNSQLSQLSQLLHPTTKAKPSKPKQLPQKIHQRLIPPPSTRRMPETVLSVAVDASLGLLKPTTTIQMQTRPTNKAVRALADTALEAAIAGVDTMGLLHRDLDLTPSCLVLPGFELTTLCPVTSHKDPHLVPVLMDHHLNEAVLFGVEEVLADPAEAGHIVTATITLVVAPPRLRPTMVDST